MKPILLHLLRDVFDNDSTLGQLMIGEKSFGFTCEDEDRGLQKNWTLDQIKATKVKRETAIPTGSYKVVKVWSGKRERFVLGLEDVPGFRYIQIHSGNKESHTEGCILPGLNRDKGAMTVGKSAAATNWLTEHIFAHLDKGGECFITITRDLKAFDAYREKA